MVIHSRSSCMGIATETSPSATAATVMVCVDLVTGAPRPVDELMRAALEGFLDDGEISDGDAAVAGLVNDATMER